MCAPQTERSACFRHRRQYGRESARGPPPKSTVVPARYLEQQISPWIVGEPSGQIPEYRRHRDRSLSSRRSFRIICDVRQARGRFWPYALRQRRHLVLAQNHLRSAVARPNLASPARSHPQADTRTRQRWRWEIPIPIQPFSWPKIQFGDGIDSNHAILPRCAADLPRPRHIALPCLASTFLRSRSCS